MIRVMFLGLNISLLRRKLYEQEQGRTVVPKQRKDYQKKDLQLKLMEGPTDKLNIDTHGGVTHGHFWVTLLLIKQVEWKMILQICLLSRMPRTQGFPLSLRISQNRGC